MNNLKFLADLVSEFQFLFFKSGKGKDNMFLLQCPGSVNTYLLPGMECSFVSCHFGKLGWVILLLNGNRCSWIYWNVLKVMTGKYYFEKSPTYICVIWCVWHIKQFGTGLWIKKNNQTAVIFSYGIWCCLNWRSTAIIQDSEDIVTFSRSCWISGNECYIFKERRKQSGRRLTDN